MISKSVMISLMVVCIVAMLAEETEGFLSFLSPSDYQKKLQNDRIRVGKKVPVHRQQRSEEHSLSEVLGMEDMKDTIKFCVPLEIGIKMNIKQFQKYKELLGELLKIILSEGTNGK
ncbi:motilin-like isoform X2 [Scyliorhinus canicula]|nr:motilin-like isoform X2 [Scyliorhinus canicula]